jgi:hypothetical protein
LASAMATTHVKSTKSTSPIRMRHSRRGQEFGETFMKLR